MKEYIMLGIVAALLLLSGVQALQINEMREAMTGNVVVVGTPAGQQAAVPQQQPAQAPTMVGGC